MVITVGKYTCVLNGMLRTHRQQDIVLNAEKEKNTQCVYSRHAFV